MKLLLDQNLSFKLCQALAGNFPPEDVPKPMRRSSLIGSV